LWDSVNIAEVGFESPVCFCWGLASGQTTFLSWCGIIVRRVNPGRAPRRNMLTYRATEHEEVLAGTTGEALCHL